MTVTRAAASSSAQPLEAQGLKPAAGNNREQGDSQICSPPRVLEDRALGSAQPRAAGKPGPELSSASHGELTDIGVGLGLEAMGRAPRRGWGQARKGEN